MLDLVTASFTPVSPGGTSFSNGPSTVLQSGGTSALGIASVLGVVVEFLAIISVLSVVGVLIIVVVSNRADPDPSGRRPQAVYFFAVSFVTLVTSVLGSTVVVASAVQLIGRHASSLNNVIARTVLLGGLIAVVSFFVFFNHLRRGLALTASTSVTETTSPSRRVGQSYVGAVAFVSVLVGVIAMILAVYLLFAIAGPGVFGSFGGRAPEVRYFFIAIYLLVVFSVILWTHRDLVAPGLKPFGFFDTEPSVGAPDPMPTA